MGRVSAPKPLTTTAAKQARTAQASAAQKPSETRPKNEMVAKPAVRSEDVFDSNEKWGVEAQRVDVRTLPPLEIAGRPIPRIAPPPTRPTGIGKALCDLILGNALNPVINHFVVVKPSADFRGKAAGAQAVSEPLPPGIESGDEPLGEVAILRPGLGNLAPSPSMVFRTAMMSGRVVLAYSNMTEGSKRNLREVRQLEGVPVPPELRGKIFAIGSEQNNLISFPQASDVMLEQLQIMHDQQARLGVDVFQSGATVVAHSQGGLETVLTRRRLEEAGLPNVINRLVAVGSPFRGANMADRLIGLASASAAGLVDSDDGMDAVGSLDPDRTRRYIGEADQKYVDLSLYGEIKGPPQLGLQFGLPPLVLREKDPVRPALRLASALGDVGSFRVTARGLLNAMWFIADDDGLVAASSAQFGREHAELDAPHDHLGVWENWGVIDEAAARIVAQAAEDKKAARRASA